MYYLIIGEDIPNSLEKRLNARPEHIQRLNALRDDGRLLTAGPIPCIDNENPGDAGFSGSVIIAEFDSLESAQQWAEADPYKHAGVYQQVTVQPYKRVY